MSSETTTSSTKTKKKESLGWMEWIKGWACVFHEFLFQRFMSSHLQNPLPLPPLNHLTCIVTGSTSGIGRETARQLAVAGARVVMAVRNTEAAHELIQQWQNDWSGRGLPLNLERNRNSQRMDIKAHASQPFSSSVAFTTPFALA